jgi:hypothetical protein
MIDILFAAFGNMFATGLGILLLAVLTGATLVLWDWRIAVLGAVLVHLGSSSMLVLVHGVPALVAAGQLFAVVLSATMLAVAGFLHPYPSSLRQAGNWLLRLMALIFIVAAWWYLDPGYTLPSFSQAETDLLLWTGICGLALWSFSGSPLMAGAAALLWSTPMYALASVLLPGSGLPAIVGIMDVIVVLACSYLVLLEPASARGVARRVIPKDVTANVIPQPRRSPEVVPPVPATGSPITSEPIQGRVAQ